LATVASVELSVQVLEIAERASEEEVLADVAEGLSTLPFVLAQYGRQALRWKP
jgi:CRISPR/Cas system-associated protein Csx1